MQEPNNSMLGSRIGHTEKKKTEKKSREARQSKQPNS